MDSSRIRGEQFKQQCDTQHAQIQTRLEQLQKQAGDNTNQDFLEKLNEILIDIDLLWNHAVLFSYNHPEESVRKAAEQCDNKLNQMDAETVSYTHLTLPTTLSV